MKRKHKHYYSQTEQNELLKQSDYYCIWEVGSFPNNQHSKVSYIDSPRMCFQHQNYYFLNCKQQFCEHSYKKNVMPILCCAPSEKSSKVGLGLLINFNLKH